MRDFSHDFFTAVEEPVSPSDNFLRGHFGIREVLVEGNLLEDHLDITSTEAIKFQLENRICFSRPQLLEEHSPERSLLTFRIKNLGSEQ